MAIQGLAFVCRTVQGLAFFYFLFFLKLKKTYVMLELSPTPILSIALNV